MRRGLRIGATVVGLAATAACGSPPTPDEAEGGLHRETFIATYVDLRVAALRNEGVMDPRLKESVLANHEVTDEELVDFAERHGRDVAFMRDVWNEVESRMDSIRALGGGGD